MNKKIRSILRDLLDAASTLTDASGEEEMKQVAKGLSKTRKKIESAYTDLRELQDKTEKMLK